MFCYILLKQPHPLAFVCEGRKTITAAAVHVFVIVKKVVTALKDVIHIQEIPSLISGQKPAILTVFLLTLSRRRPG